MLNKICFTICIVCIVLGAVISLVMIWTESSESELLWKSLLSIIVFFLAACLTLAVNSTMGRTVARGD